jgi:peptidoglycan/xylan/chitin deacetylase (PgdA/CDA1 family)
MIVKNTISPCWLASDATIAKVGNAVAGLFADAPERTRIFFRADDVAVPGDNCRRMLDVFRKHRVPLHLAVTPAWLTAPRWAVLKEWAGSDDDLWCWHQHGWRHQNHQHNGKKSEFGTDRTRDEKRQDIIKGRDRLRSIMGKDYHPVFTPPWNRFDEETGEVLLELGYKAVSRSQGERKRVPLPKRVRGIPVNVDLHTRSEPDPDDGLAALLEEFMEALRFGRVGVMLHHQRMNEASFSFLDQCLAGVSASPTLSPIGLNEAKVSIDQAIFTYSTSI